MDANTN